MSTERDFDRFVHGVRPWNLRPEVVRLPPDVLDAIAYQRQTDQLVAAMRSGSRVRLEAAVLAVGYPHD